MITKKTRVWWHRVDGSPISAVVTEVHGVGWFTSDGCWVPPVLPDYATVRTNAYSKLFPKSTVAVVPMSTLVAKT